MRRVLTLQPAWTNVAADLRRSGPYTVWIVTWYRGKDPAYGATEAHWVSWHGFWLSPEPFAGQNGAREAMREWDERLGPE